LAVHFSELWLGSGQGVMGAFFGGVAQLLRKRGRVLNILIRPLFFDYLAKSLIFAQEIWRPLNKLNVGNLLIKNFF
jgi:hypothetical protein